MWKVEGGRCLLKLAGNVGLRGGEPIHGGPGEGLVGRAGLQLYTSATTQYPVLVPSLGDGLVRWALA